MSQPRTIALVFTVLAVGCGSSGTSTRSASTTAATTSATTSQTQAGLPFSDVHGELVFETAATGQVLAFLEDGATDPREIADPSGLVAAGAHVGSTLELSGDRFNPNTSGLTTLSESVLVSAFALDEVSATARLALASGTAQVVLTANDGTSYEPIGALASQLLVQTLDTPVRVTGRVDLAHQSVTGSAGLIVTSWRETAEIGFSVVGGLTGMNERYTVDDLPVTGSESYDLSFRTNFGVRRLGKGRLSEADRVALEAAVTAANLRSQPAVFPQTMMVFDIPTQYIDFADKAGPLRITIRRPTVLPPEVDALVTLLNVLDQKIATSSVLDKGSMSSVTVAGNTVIRDQVALDALWAQHKPGVTAPTVDFSLQFVVALFMGQQSSGGYSIAVSDAERFGDDIHLRVERSAPTGPAPSVITSPFEIVAVTHKGATGDVTIDGVKQ
jgi:hypothetical protein